MLLNSQSRFALVGPGAIGLYYGGLLAKSGVPLHVLARSDYDDLAAGGMTIRMIDPQLDQLSEVIQATPAQIAKDPAEIGVVDCVIITAKSTVNESLLDTLRPLIEPNRTVVLTLQNGMGNAEFFARHFPETPMLCGLCFVCVNRTQSGVVENYLPGRVEIGSLKDQWPELADSVVGVFEQAGITVSHSETFDRSLWRKLCWNVPFNGLSIAAGGITTDKILADSALAERARRLMEELRGASALEGYPISDRFIQGQFDVTEKMGAYQPSSLIDFLDGRPVEIESIWGEPLRRGKALGLAMTELEALYSEITAQVAAR